MSFHTLSTGFARFIFDSERKTFIFGTPHYVGTILKSNINNESFYVEESTLSLTIDPIALSFLIFGKSLPDFIDIETRRRSLFGYFLYSILDETDEIISRCIELLEDYFGFLFRAEAKDIIEQIFPQHLKRKCLWIVEKNLYRFVENYLPLNTQEELEDCLDDISTSLSRRTDEIISSVLVESQNTSTVNLKSGRVKASRDLWSAYKYLLDKEELETEQHQSLIRELKSKAMSSEEPFFSIRRRVLRMYTNMNIEKYIQNESLDFDNLRISISVASTYKDLWFYAIKMKGLIFEVICSIWLSNKFKTRIEYRCEPNKLPLSEILGQDIFEKITSVISSDYQTIDPVPDFFYKSLDSEGNLVHWIIEVGWWTDAQSKIVQEQEKWAPFLKAAEEKGVKIELQVFVQTSRKMDEWPIFILRHRESMKWVEASKSVFRILMLTPDEEAELETTMLSSTEARRLISVKTRVICPLTHTDFERKKRQVLNSIKTNLTLNHNAKGHNHFKNDTSFDLSRSVEIIHKLENSLQESGLKPIDIDFEVDQIYQNMKLSFQDQDIDQRNSSSNLIGKKYTPKEFRDRLISCFEEEEELLVKKRVSYKSKLISNNDYEGTEVNKLDLGKHKENLADNDSVGPQLSIFKFLSRFKDLNSFDNSKKIFGVQDLDSSDIFDIDHTEIGQSFSSNLIDSLLRMPMPGRTSRQKRIRKYYSTMYMRLLRMENVKFFVDRMMRVTSVSAAHQSIGGKIDESKLKGFEKTIVRNCIESMTQGVSFSETVKIVLSKFGDNYNSEQISDLLKIVLKYLDDSNEIDTIYKSCKKRLCYVVCTLTDFLFRIFQEQIITSSSYEVLDNERIKLTIIKDIKVEEDENAKPVDDYEKKGSVLYDSNDNEILIKAIENTLNLDWTSYILSRKDGINESLILSENGSVRSDDIDINDRNGTKKIEESILSVRKPEVIDRVYELLGHRSLEEQKELLQERVSGVNYQRNNPSIHYNISDVIAYNDDLLTNELSNFGKYVCVRQSKTVRKSMSEFWIEYIEYSKHFKDPDAIILVNLYYEVFNLSKMNDVQKIEFKLHIKNLDNLILTLCLYQRFVEYMLLSVVAKAHLLVNNKYNGLKEHSIPSIKARLYVMQPDKSENATTPCVLVVNNHSFHRFNLDYIKSKLWLSIPYMILLSYCELSQEFGLYNQGIILSGLYKFKVNGEIRHETELKKKQKADERRVLRKFYLDEEIEPDLLKRGSDPKNQNFQSKYIYRTELKNGYLSINPEFDDTDVTEYLNELMSLSQEEQNIAAGVRADEQFIKLQQELIEKEEMEREKIAEFRRRSGLPDENISLHPDPGYYHIFDTRSSSSTGDDMVFQGSLIVNDRLINGLLNYTFLPAVYNNKYNNEFRQALRYIYAGIDSHYQDCKIGKKYSHITRYLELYMDKIIGLYSSHDKNRSITFSGGKLTGPCWLGYLPIINNNVLTCCMFICHIFNKVIANYDESLLKTMDGTFEIPLEMFNEMRVSNDLLDDLTFGTNKTPLLERINWLSKNFTNKSYLIPEVLDIGIHLLRDKLASTSFKSLEYSRGLHNNFMDIAEVTNCISAPKKSINLADATKAIISEKFNKVIKFASNKRNKLQDQSFVESILKLAEEQFQLIPKKLDLFKKYINSRSKFSRQYIVNFEKWTTDNENETIINTMKILLKSVNTSLKNIDSMVFKKIKLAEWPDHLIVLKQLYNKVNPDFSKNIIINFDALTKAESELRTLYMHFNEVKSKLIRNDKYLSHVGVRTTLVEHERVFRMTFSKELNTWLKFLLNCAALSPVSLLSIVKDPVMIHKLLHNEQLQDFNFICHDLGANKYPFLTRYICGCVISKTKLCETNFVAVQASIDEIGSVMRTFFHNSDSKSLYCEFCKLYIMIAQGNWKTGQRLLQGWQERGLPRSTRNKVIFEALRTSNLYNSHNVAAVAFSIIKREDWSYFAGLAPKAQLGGLRDLLVQDFESKIVLHISEQMALYCLENLPNDILGHPDAKDYALKRMTELLTNPETKDACVFICGDKKKWAQKHTTLFFYKLVDKLFEENGCKFFLKMVMIEGLKKEIEIPSAFIRYYTKRLIKDEDFTGEELQTKLILLKYINDPKTKQYHKYLLNCILNNKNYIELFSHMGQGIHHKFSSLYGHAAELASIQIAKHALARQKGVDVEVEYFRSSDDYTQLLLFKKNNAYIKDKEQLTEISKLYFRYYINSMMMCNIRESEKTVITSKFGEIYSTYASTEVIPAPFKFYIPNIMFSSAFTPLEIWRVKFAKMQQLFDNGMSLVGCFNFAVLENIQYQRFLRQNIFESNSMCVLPNTSITFIPYLSDVVFGTLSNSEIKILRSQVYSRNLTVGQLHLFTEFFQEIETKKSKAFYDLESPQESILKEIYSLPFSRKYDKMKKMIHNVKEESNLFKLNSNNNLNEEILSSENKGTIVLNLLTRSSKTDSVLGEEIRFKLALNSKGIIWGLSGGTREEAINMLRQVTSKHAFYNKTFSQLWQRAIELQQDGPDDENSLKFLSGLGNKIIKETINFDIGFSTFQTRYFEINSIVTPMKKITHWNSTNKFKLTNQLEQVLSYMLDPKTFLEIKPRVSSAELLETDAQKVESFIGIDRNTILSLGLKMNDLMLRCLQLKGMGKGVRSSIIITHYDDEWKNIPKAALMYNTVHHWVVDFEHEIKYPYSSVEQLLDFCLEVMSAIAYHAGTEYCKRYVVTKLFSLPPDRYPLELELKESLMTTLLKQVKFLDQMSRINKDYQTLISLLFDNLTDPSIEVHQEYQEKHTYTELHTDSSGTYQIYTYLKEDGYCSIFMKNSLCVVKTDVTDSNILQYLLELVRKIKNSNKLTILECLKYIHSNYNFDLLNEVYNLYMHSRYTSQVSIKKGFLNTSTFILDSMDSNFNFIYSSRPVLRSFSVKSKKYATQYLYIDALSWKKLQLTVKSSNIGEQAAFIEDILSGKKVGKFEDLRIITKQQNKQWLSKSTVEFLINNLNMVNNRTEEKLEQSLLFKLRSSQILKVSGSAYSGAEKKWSLDDEDYLNQGGNYFFDSSDNTLIQIEHSPTLRNIMIDPFSTLHRLERDKKIPTFLSPYIVISNSFSKLQDISVKFFSNLDSDEYLSFCLLIRILKTMPKHLFPDEDQNLYTMLLESYNTFLFDLPILDKYFFMEQLYTVVSFKFTGNIKFFNRIVKKVLLSDHMTIDMNLDDDEYSLKVDMGLDSVRLIEAFKKDIQYSFNFSPVTFNMFITNLLTYSRSLLNPEKFEYYGQAKEVPLFSSLQDVFSMVSQVNIASLFGKRNQNFMSKNFFQQLLGEPLEDKEWDEDRIFDISKMEEDDDFYGGF